MLKIGNRRNKRYDKKNDTERYGKKKDMTLEEFKIEKKAEEL